MPDDLAAQHRAQLGDRITKARSEAGLSQRDVAVAVNATGADVTVQTISLWEKGKRFPAHKHQVALARALGVAWSDLFDLTDEDVA